jgi:hypothetical protein
LHLTNPHFARAFAGLTRLFFSRQPSAPERA